MTRRSGISLPAAENIAGGALPASAQLQLGPSVWEYRQHPHPSGGRAPIVPVELYGPLNWARTDALLDSGADISAIPYGWAGPLGVDLERAESKTAWGNGVLAEYLFPRERLRLAIAGLVIDLQAAFTPWEHLVLGRDVFRHFRVIFDERAGQVVLDPHPS
jgi:hypothetical protein